MVDGVGVLQQMMWAMRGVGAWNSERHSNLLDGAAPFYDTYLCEDGRHVAVGAIEPQFFRALLAGLGLDSADLPDQHDRERWPELRARFAKTFLSQPRDHWAKTFADTDACVTPVLSYDEVAAHPHLAARETMITIDGITQPAPAPRFSRTATSTPTPPVRPGADTAAVLSDWQA
jgi:alpha-methylacyl-CoA racemase